MDKLFVRVVGALMCSSRARRATSRGQATTEYVLVLLGVAAIALAVAAWATRTGKIGELIDRVFDSISSQIS
jgi:hypothetical protein